MSFHPNIRSRQGLRFKHCRVAKKGNEIEQCRKWLRFKHCGIRSQDLSTEETKSTLEHRRNEVDRSRPAGMWRTPSTVPTGTNSDEEPGLTGGHENQGRCNQKQAEGNSYGKTNQSTNKSKQRSSEEKNQRCGLNKNRWQLSRTPASRGTSRTQSAAPRDRAGAAKTDLATRKQKGENN
jgi:hypothetical protein